MTESSNKIKTMVLKNYSECYRQMPRHNKTSLAVATIKQQPEDFLVTENLGFEPDEQGEHQLLYIRKRLLSTAEVADKLARFAGVKPMTVSFCGMKDKHAVTKQWFSIQLPGQENLKYPEDLGFSVIRSARHSRKLRRGTHNGNDFELILRHCSDDKAEWEKSLLTLKNDGFPNYFAEQRFGREFSNMRNALAMFQGKMRRVKKQQKSIYLSAARSWLFNEILAQRVADSSWNKALAGDAMMLQGSHSFFNADLADETLEPRLQQLDVHPTGPLWGRGQPPVDEARAEWEKQQLVEFDEYCDALERAGMNQQRRALRAVAQDLSWQWLSDDSLKLSFHLDNGIYATAMLRELAKISTGEAG